MILQINQSDGGIALEGLAKDRSVSTTRKVPNDLFDTWLSFGFEISGFA
jgi:hypothetical protein